MGLLVQTGLKKTESVVKVKQGIGEVVDVILSAKDIIGLAVQTVPQAALAWTGVCFVLQVSVLSRGTRATY
jgi:N-terminal domain of NWD NACHT-NTPase